MAILPISLGVVPFGVIAGGAMIESGIPPQHAIAMTIVSFTGAAQLAAIDLIDQTAPVAVIVLTAVIINLRFTMYSASMAPYFRRFGALTKWLGAYVLTDEAYAISITRFRDGELSSHSQKWFYFGAAIPFWATWHLSAALGVLLGTSVLSDVSLAFAVPLTFIALLIPDLDDRPTMLAALISGVASILLGFIPFNLGFVLAVLIGITAGTAVEQRSTTQSEQPVATDTGCETT